MQSIIYIDNLTRTTDAIQYLYWSPLRNTECIPLFTLVTSREHQVQSIIYIGYLLGRPDAVHYLHGYLSGTPDTLHYLHWSTLGNTGYSPLFTLVTSREHRVQSNVLRMTK